MWSLGGLLIKSINAHPLAIAGTRSAISCIIMILYVKKPKFNWSFTQIAAGVAYASMVITFVFSTKLTTAANAILLEYTAPIFVALLSAWMLKEKPKAIDWVTIMLVFGGMVLFFLDSLDAKGFAGNIFGLLSGISYALFTVFMRMQKNGSPIESVILGNAISAIVGIPFIFMSVPDFKGWLFLVILGVVQLGIPYIMYSEAIKNASALEASIITMIEPILNPIWVVLIIGEIPGVLSIIGGIIVIATVAIRCVILSSTKHTDEENLNEKMEVKSIAS
ncbi:MAG: EamA family transporter [Clostridiaceae bacterium]|nr:EamA family transporter [Clostridiaceae bacterium]